MDKIPTIHPEHLVDRELIDQALKLLEISREPRNELVPIGKELALPEKLPESGLGSQAALEMIAPDALETSSQLHHPGFMAHMDPPTPAVAWVASLWQTATNQNLLHPDVAPKGRLLSQRVVDWQRFGVVNIDAGPSNATFFENFDQRRFINNRSARGVDEVGRRFHQFQFERTDEPARTLAQ